MRRRSPVLDGGLVALSLLLLLGGAACSGKGTGKACTANAECGSDERCVDAKCEPAPSCAADAECSGGRVCEAGLCVAACSADADCGSPAQAWACEAGHCNRRCLRDASCPSGDICVEAPPAGGICRDAECSTTADCPGTDVICTSASHGRCEPVTPCSSDAQCAFGETCGLPSPCPPGYDCSAGNEFCVARPSCVVDTDCGQGEFCDQGYCFVASACQSSSECGGMECVGGLCVPWVCRGPADCAANEVCVGGACVSGDPGAAVDRVTILSPGGVLLTGETRTLIAVAYDANGDAIPGATFTWTSSDAAIVAVDGAGVVTGGSTPGTATITAAAGGQQDGVDFTLLPAISGDFRVSVLDADTGAPVSSATVQVIPEGGVPLESSVDGGGVALFAGMTTFPVSVHVYDDAHDYVSLFGVGATDVVVPLPPRSSRTMAGGLTGSMDYSKVTTTGDISIGLAGLSFGQGLTDLDLTAVMGDVFVVTIPGMGQSVPLPGGMTAEAAFGGFPVSIKTTWYARAEPGLRAVWAFAGKVGVDQFGGGGAAETLAGILPLFGLFEHGLVPRVLVTESPTITDTADVDGDGNTTEQVPDWSSFPTRRLSPGQAQTLRLFVDPPAMPTLGGTPTDTVILMAGVRAGRLGLTPLGLSATELQSAGDTEAPPVTMRLTPVYGGLEVGEYQILAMAASTQGGGGGFDMPAEVSTRVVTAATLPRDLLLDPFLPFPEATSYDASARTLNVESLSAASLHRERLASEGRAWIVLGPKTGGAWELPAPPVGMDDPAASPVATTLTVIELSAGDYQSITDASGETLLSLDALTAAYARLVR